jgi:hypothetical protein
MSLLGDIITIAQIANAALPELQELGVAIEKELQSRDAAAATQAAIAGADAAVDADEQIEYDRRKADGL